MEPEVDPLSFDLDEFDVKGKGLLKFNNNHSLNSIKKSFIFSFFVENKLLITLNLYKLQ